MTTTDWLLLALGVGLICLGAAPLSRTPSTARMLAIAGALLGVVAVVLLIVRVAD